MKQNGIYRVSPEELRDLEATERSAGTFVLALPRTIRSKKAFFEAVSDLMPLDPPMSREQSYNWDALADSLWGGLYSTPPRTILIVWAGASDMFRVSPADFDIASGILGDIALELGEPKLTRGVPKELVVALGGSWGEFA